MANTPCYYISKRIGSLKGCSGVPAIDGCLNPDVPSGLCVSRAGNVARDGTLKPSSTDNRGGQQYTVFPFTQRDIDAGKRPWDSWVLSCHCCPYRREPPLSVLELYTRREELSKQISDYEAATTLEERDEAAKRLLST